jgi:hypothetical protein
LFVKVIPAARAIYRVRRVFYIQPRLPAPNAKPKRQFGDIFRNVADNHCQRIFDPAS